MKGLLCVILGAVIGCTLPLYPAQQNKVNNPQVALKEIEDMATYSAACHWVSRYPEPQNPHFKAVYEELRLKYRMPSKEQEDKKAALKKLKAQKNLSHQELIKEIDKITG